MNPEDIPFFKEKHIYSTEEISDGTDTITEVETKEGTYILKVHSFEGLNKEEFETEAKLLEYISNCDIPAPKFYARGTQNEIPYIITGKEEGTHPNFETYTGDELGTFIEQYFYYSGEINSIPLPEMNQYGALTNLTKDSAMFKTGYESWREFFLTMTGYLVDDISVDNIPYTEQEVEAVHKAIIDNSGAIPETPTRTYIHFDYRPGNILTSETGEVISILDWAKGLIGDNHFATIEAYFYLTYALEGTPHSREKVPCPFTKQIQSERHHLYMLFFYLCEMSAFNIWMAPFTEEEREEQYQTSKDHIQHHLSEINLID